MIRRAVLVALVVGASAWLLPAAAEAQVPSIQMTATPSVVGLDDQFELEIRVSVSGGGLEDIVLPEADLAAFDVLERRLSRPFQFSFGFGQQTIVQQTTVHTFKMRPRRTGTFTIRPAQVRVGGRAYQGQSVVVTVVQGRAPASSTPAPPLSPLVPFPPTTPLLPPGTSSPFQPAPPPEAPPEGLDGAAYDDEIFLRTTVDRDRAYLGEQVTMTLYVYARTRISDIDVVREPGTEGFWTEDLIGPVRRLDFTETTVGGARFQVAVLRKVGLFGMSAGTMTITPGEIEVETRAGLFSRGRNLRRSGVPVTVEVLPLPAEGQPPGFEASNVGQYEMQATLDRDRVSGGDAVTLTVRIEGEGNLRQLRVPTLASSRDFRVLPPQPQPPRVVTENDRVRGDRTWELLVFPLREGELTLPPLDVPFFDPRARRYRTLSSPTLTVHVVGAPPVATGDDTSTGTGPQIRSIRNRAELRRGGKPLIHSGAYLAVVALPPGLVLALFVGRTVAERRRRALGDRPRRALGDARKRLRSARRLARAGDTAGTFAEIARLLQGYLEDRLGERVGHLTMTSLRDLLVARGYPCELAERVVGELENCDFARFTPANIRDREAAECVQRTATLLPDLDQVQPKEAA